jgi:hypothetical protein
VLNRPEPDASLGAAAAAIAAGPEMAMGRFDVSTYAQVVVRHTPCRSLFSGSVLHSCRDVVSDTGELEINNGHVPAAARRR